MKTVLLWLVPPFIGAVIGYITNAIAIKMLFRPLKEVRLGKWRLPFTPGILPSQRHQLAQSIGRMVERELLTPQIVRARLQREDVKESVKNSAANFMDKLLSTRIAELPFDKINPIIGDVLKSFLQSPVFVSILDEIIDSIMENVKKSEFFSKNIREILGSEKTTALEKEFGKIVSDHITANGNAISEQITVIFANNFMQIVDACINFLERGDIRKDIETQGRIFLERALRKLSVTQRFFLTIGQYDERLSERMPEIIDDLIRQLYAMLSDSETRQRLLTLFTDNIGRLLSNSGPRTTDIVVGFLSTQTTKPLKELLKNVKKENIRVFEQKIIDFTRNSLVFVDLFKKILEKHGDAVVADIFPITAGQKSALDAFIAEKLLLIADEQIGNALVSINVMALVTDRIDELDMIQVERIILDIMANQLKWINVFGAILGALIGVFQSLFSWLIR